MFLVHRLKGEPLFLNVDLVESVEGSPDTRIRLVDGRQILVVESPAEVAEAIREARAAQLAAARRYDEPIADAGGTVVTLRRGGEDGA